MPEIASHVRVTPLPWRGWLAALALCAFLGFAYGPSFAALVTTRSPTVAALACGPGHTVDLVAPGEVDPAQARPRPLWFACRDAAGAIRSDEAAHRAILLAGRVGLASALLALLVPARLAFRALARPGPDGRSTATRTWEALPSSARRRLRALAFAAPVGFALAIVPIAVTATNLHEVPGVGALVCASGRLAPHAWGERPAFGGRSSRRIACLDEAGRVLPEDGLHERAMRWIILAYWLPLAALLYPVGASLRWSGHGRSGMGTMRRR